MSELDPRLLVVRDFIHEHFRRGDVEGGTQLVICHDCGRVLYTVEKKVSALELLAGTVSPYEVYLASHDVYTIPAELYWLCVDTPNRRRLVAEDLVALSTAVSVSPG